MKSFIQVFFVMFVVFGGHSAVASSEDVDYIDANLSFFDDTRSGTGVKFSAYPVQYDNTVAYPIAVHQRNFSAFFYDVLKIYTKDSVVFGHVVDMCSNDDAECTTNAKKNDANFLIDLHVSGWDQVSSDELDEGIVPCQVEKVGTLSPKDMPAAALESWILCDCHGHDCEDASWEKKNACHSN